jgi:hypothetical protein
LVESEAVAKRDENSTEKSSASAAREALFLLVTCFCGSLFGAAAGAYLGYNHSLSVSFGGGPVLMNDGPAMLSAGIEACFSAAAGVLLGPMVTLLIRTPSVRWWARLAICFYTSIAAFWLFHWWAA